MVVVMSRSNFHSFGVVVNLSLNLSKACRATPPSLLSEIPETGNPRHARSFKACGRSPAPAGLEHASKRCL
jgi:hypothetical protein